MYSFWMKTAFECFQMQSISRIDTPIMQTIGSCLDSNTKTILCFGFFLDANLPTICENQSLLPYTQSTDNFSGPSAGTG